MTTFNNISQDFFNSLNNYASNPLILVIFIFVILIYYILFAFIGGSSNESSNSGGGFILFEGLLWGLFILLIFVNGIYYFYNINILTYFNDIFSNEPEIVIEKTITPIIDNSKNVIQKDDIQKEVYHIPGNRFTYHDAKAICNAFDSDLASYEQLLKSHEIGANWCSYGWTKDQLGLYPTSQNHFKKMQKREGHEYDCGLPGINGGFVSNPHTKLGANCYGIKPKKSILESEVLDNQELYPKSQKEHLFEQRVKYWKNRIGNILINPFNNNNWFKSEEIQKEQLQRIENAKKEAEKAEQIKKLKQNQVTMAQQDANIANVSASAAKKRSEILNINNKIPN